MNGKPNLDRAGIVNRLAAFREIWEIEAGDLIETQVSLGLLFADIVGTLGLDHTEKLAILGPQLTQEIEKVYGQGLIMRNL